MTRKILLVAVVAMLATGTSAALAFGVGPQAAVEDDATAVHDGGQYAIAQENETVEDANVTFENQTSNGTAVVVQRAVLPEGGFVVIHAANETVNETTNETEFAAGEVLGNSTFLEPGVHENVTVILEQPLNESQFLIAMAHRDTNNNTQYEFPEADAPYTEEGGAVTDLAFVTLEEGGQMTTTVAANETAEGTETTTEGNVTYAG